MASHKRKKITLLLGLILLGLIASCLAEYILPYSPYEQHLSLALQAPSFQHWLGTDVYGRDLLARTLAGAKLTIITALAVALLSALIGSCIGLFCGYRQGKAVTCLLRLADIFLSFPTMVFAIAVAGILGGGTFNAAAAITAVTWPKYTRLVRNLVSPLRREYYIEPAQMSGFTTGQILFQQILPEVIGPVFITAALDLGTIITEIAGLSFLGLGAAPPAAEWGSMMSSSRLYMQTAPWTVFVPGAAIVITVALFQLLADSLRDFFDTKLVR